MSKEECKYCRGHDCEMCDGTQHISDIEGIVEEFAKAHTCINTQCDNYGTLTVQGADGEPEPEQCEYCYRVRFTDHEWLRTTLKSQADQFAKEKLESQLQLALELAGVWRKEKEAMVKEITDRVMRWVEKDAPMMKDIKAIAKKHGVDLSE